MSFAKVAHISVMSGSVLNVKLQVLGDGLFHYSAGQYLDMTLSDGKSRTFSIASSPDCGDILEFHMRDVEAGLLERLLRKHLKASDQISIDGPKGDYIFEAQHSQPLIMLAGGTGFAPVKSMLEYAIEHAYKRKVLLYWGARTRAELYFDVQVKSWADKHVWLDYVPVLSDEPWEGRMGYVHDVVLADIPSLAGYEVYASGSPPMIKSSYEAFLVHGLDASKYYSDILAYVKSL